MIGPPVAVLVISTGPATLLWLVLAAALVLTGTTALLLDHRLHRHRSPQVPLLHPNPRSPH